MPPSGLYGLLVEQAPADHIHPHRDPTAPITLRTDDPVIHPPKSEPEPRPGANEAESQP